MEENGKRKVGEEPGGGKAPQKGGSKVATWIIIAVAAVVLVVALVNIIGIKSEDIANEQTYRGLKEVAEGTAEPSPAANPRDRKIDFDALRAVNEDIVGWIYVPNTAIDYPVVLGEDNDYYISHSAEKEQNRAGAIFLDYRNKEDFTDPNTVIYGHRMNDGSMFADLHKFEDESFLKENKYVYLYLPGGVVQVYDIFEASVVGDMDEAYTISFADDAAFESYLTKMKNRSASSFNLELSAQDRIITLSTCVRGQDENRYIVQAVREKSQEGV